MEQRVLNLPISYSGKRFSGARIIGTGDWVFKGESAPTFGPPSTFFVIDAGPVGRGRPYEPGLSAAWRDMSDTDVADREQVVRFLHRHGDPYGKLPERGDTAGWRTLQNQLREIAGAWDPELGRDGISRVLADERNYELAGRMLADGSASLWIDMLSVTRAATSGLELRVPTLGAFMIATALADWQERVPMRKCAHCGSWMRARRRTAHYCNKSCRSLASRKR